MPKVTLSFKGKIISSHHLTNNEVTIGRNTDCDIVIDSLAVATSHVAISSNKGECSVSALDSEFPLILNHEQVDNATLKHGDTLKIGKHTVDFIDDIVSVATPDLIQDEVVVPFKKEESPDRESNAEAGLTGILQIQNGSNIGRIIPLNRSLIKIGKSGDECVVIAYRDNGYYLSLLEGNTPPKVNQASIGEHSKHLADGDQIEIRGTLMHFQEKTRQRA